MKSTSRRDRAALIYFSRIVITIAVFFAFCIASLTPLNSVAPQIGVAPTASANSTYVNLATGNLTFGVSTATASQITVNDNWSGVTGVEGYFGLNLTATHGIDPQTVLGTEFAGNVLPNTPTNVAANKSNPNAFNAGGLAEFDSGPFLAIGFQGNVQANPYLVFYLNTLGRTSVTISYDVTDIDGGSNNAVSPVALQYRVGTTGLFTNIPAGFIADASDGPNLAGRVTAKSVMLPPAAANQPQVQVRIITTNAANSSGGSSPDEWIGVNNVVVSSVGPTAADAGLAGRVFDPFGRAVSGAVITITDQNGEVHFATSNTFGYFKYSGLRAGRTYVVAVKTRRYLYAPRTVDLNDDLFDLNFYPTP